MTQSEPTISLATGLKLRDRVAHGFKLASLSGNLCLYGLRLPLKPSRFTIHLEIRPSAERLSYFADLIFRGMVREASLYSISSGFLPEKRSNLYLSCPNRSGICTRCECSP